MRMLEEKSWEEFRATGLLWWINRTLHLFGWAIVVQLEDDGKTISRCYPARTKFRGFDERSDTEGFVTVSQYLKATAGELVEEARLPSDAEDRL